MSSGTGVWLHLRCKTSLHVDRNRGPKRLSAGSFAPKASQFGLNRYLGTLRTERESLTSLPRPFSLCPQKPAASRHSELGELAAFLGRADPWFESIVNTLCPAIHKLAEMVGGPPWESVGGTFS